MNNNKIKVGVSNKEGQLGFVFSRGGLREGSGRKGFGVTKKVSLTLTEEMWKKIDDHCTDNKRSRSEVIRNILESFYSQ
ncbi:ribbon-helix-helix domain-containing protein [Cohnella terricola]|uniref:CopG family transcriptional regulator n=1 Tax=Cohnella terricola TaxID=1289167 RepID=A0A559JFL0_9BACL|nr:ribbon-helix-helix domain-containing protein [Cohnella terricola]TVX98662.1 CopG family transcriptional regulator [Cohnella terricola]